MILVATLVVVGAVASWSSTAAKLRENNNLGEKQLERWLSDRRVVCAECQLSLLKKGKDKKNPDGNLEEFHSFICSETDSFFYCIIEI